MRILQIVAYHVFMQAVAAVASTTAPTPHASPSTHMLHLHGTLHTKAANILAAAPTVPSTINVTALIDPSHATTADATATFAPPLSNPHPTGAPHYLFVFGDSYSELGFNLSGTKPSPLNPLGNPAYPGLTPEVGMQNWIDLVTVHANVTALTYDFAVGGASVDNSLTEGSNAKIPAFVNQSAEFLDVLAVVPRPEFANWSGEDSVFIVWFGRNDVYWTLVNGVAEPTAQLDEAQKSFLLILTRLVGKGATRFVVVGVPPIDREPIWMQAYFSQFVPQLPPLVEYWNGNLQARLKRWIAFNPDVKLSWVDVGGVYGTVLDAPEKYGAPDATCTNEHALPPSNGTNCLWADGVHPGPVINAEVAKAVGQELMKEGFFPSASQVSSASASARATAEAGKSARASQGITALDPLESGWWKVVMVVAVMAMYIGNMAG